MRDSYGNLSGIMASAPSERLVVDLCGLGSALRTYVSERGLNVSEAAPLGSRGRSFQVSDVEDSRMTRRVADIVRVDDSQGGTDPLVVHRAAREFARAELGDHRYVMVL